MQVERLHHIKMDSETRIITLILTLTSQFLREPIPSWIETYGMYDRVFFVIFTIAGVLWFQTPISLSSIFYLLKSPYPK